MQDTPFVDDQALPLSVALLVDRQCQDFEAAWQAAGAAGQPPRLETYLGAEQEPDRATLLQELIRIDVHYRRLRGEPMGAGDYLRRFRKLSSTWLSTVLAETPTLALLPSANVVAPAAGATPCVPGYEILGELGRGGMGVVYKARHTPLKRLVALKVVRVGGHASVAERARFRTEAEAIARLDHPNIVRIHEVGEHDGLPFLALELCGGGSLAEKLRATPLPPREAADLIEQLARAMAAAHAKGIVHRDLKPANVLLASDGTPKISDFGLAKMLDEAGSTVTGAILGTPSYMAPEQAGGLSGQAGPAADVYALGAILYECLAGRPPFKGATDLDTVRQVADHDPVSVRHLQPRVPRDLETICHRCLHKDPARRYESARALAEDLQRWRKGETIQARPSGTSERLFKWARRRPASAALVAVVLLASLALLGGGLWYQGRLRDALADSESQRLQTERMEEQALHERDRAQQAYESGRRVLYAAQMHLAHQSWQDAHPEHVLRLLSEWGPGDDDIRGWEWHYLRGLCHSDRRTWKADTRQLASLAFSADRRWMAAASWDRAVHLWDLQGGKQRTLAGHTEAVQEVAFSPDGRLLASAGNDATVRLWDVETGREVRTLPVPWKLFFRSVAFSPDGRLLVAAGFDGTIHCWNTASGQPARPPLTGLGPLLKVAFSRDSRFLAAGGLARKAWLWEVDGWRLVRTFEGHSAQISDLAFSPSGHTLATTSEDLTIRLWDPSSGKQRTLLRGHQAWPYRIAFSPDGRWLASAGDDQTVRLWDPAEGREVRSYRGHTSIVRGLAFTPDGRGLASAGHDGCVKLWDVERQSQEFRSLRVPGNMSVVRVAFSPDGRLLASAGRDGLARIWDAATGRQTQVFHGHRAEVWALAFSPDGRLLASSGDDATVKLWDAGTGQEVRTLRGHRGPLRDLAFSPDGSLLASGSLDGQVKLWEPATGREVHTLRGHSGHILTLAFSPDGRLLASAGKDKTVRLWDPIKGREAGTFPVQAATIGGLAFRRDGRLLASANDSGEVKVWDTAQGKELCSLRGHSGWGGRLAFSPDGHLASTGQDRTVKIWDPLSGRECLTLRCLPLGGASFPLYQVAFSPDGSQLAAAGGGGEGGVILLWETTPPEEAQLNASRPLRVGPNKKAAPEPGSLQ